ncbi:type ISP restriction/modification enzyme [Ruoffia tabacinasalis]|uniref:type ISP restriction/modification enzyme n=1 Tax=Ruoffia tabacinasalis TaxID=87458 RepID=UPI001E53085C|nr:type ISP restriction/modification enzyme [Ruoffia tabacinasalis]
MQNTIILNFKKTLDKNNDWINQRYDSFDAFYKLDNEIFNDRATGLSTSRDSWVYGFNSKKVINNTNFMIKNYNDEVKKIISNYTEVNSVDMDPTRIKWSTDLLKNVEKKNIIKPTNNIIQSMYRPFVKKNLYYQRDILERPGRFEYFFGEKNLSIVITGKGARRKFSTFVTDLIPNQDLMEKTQAYYFLNNSNNILEEKYNINNIFEKLGWSKEDLFSYIYAVLNHKEYIEKYSTNLNKSLPNISLLNNWEKIINIGYKLIELHLNYELIEPNTEVKILTKTQNPIYYVTKIKFGKYKDKSKLILNKDITIENIPEKAYEYVVNGRSAIEWIMDQYQVKTDSKSDITDDPNEYSKDPKYIFNLLLSIINVSVQTVDLVNSLPPLDTIE